MRIHRMLLPIVTATALLGLVGCSTESPSQPQDTPKEHGGLAHCLSEHGVTETAVSPAGPPAGVDPATWDQAMQACSSLAPGPAAP